MPPTTNASVQRRATSTAEDQEQCDHMMSEACNTTAKPNCKPMYVTHKHPSQCVRGRYPYPQRHTLTLHHCGGISLPAADSSAISGSSRSLTDCTQGGITNLTKSQTGVITSLHREEGNERPTVPGSWFGGCVCWAPCACCLLHHTYTTAWGRMGRARGAAVILRDQGVRVMEEGEAV